MGKGKQGKGREERTARVKVEKEREVRRKEKWKRTEERRKSREEGKGTEERRERGEGTWKRLVAVRDMTESIENCGGGIEWRWSV